MFECRIPWKSLKKTCLIGVRKEFCLRNSVSHSGRTNLRGSSAYASTKPSCFCIGLSMSRQTSTNYLQKLMLHYNPWLKLGSVTMLLEGLFYVCSILRHFKGMESGWLLTVVFPLSDWVNSWWQSCSFHKLAVSHVDEQTNKQTKIPNKYTVKNSGQTALPCDIV